MTRRLRVVKGNTRTRRESEWFEKHGPDPASGEQVVSDERLAEVLRRHYAATARRGRDGRFRRRRGWLARILGR